MPGPPRKGPGPHWEGRRAEAGDARAGEVRPFRSSEETGEQRRATASGVGGAKGRGQGERGRARHAPDTETGKRVTRAGPRTASSKPTLRRQTPKAGAVCGNAARTVLSGGRSVTGVSTGIGKNTQGRGWYSFDVAGVHFIGLINVFNFQPGFKSAGLATLGDHQLEWLEKDVAARSASTPIVVLAHLPMWTIYPQWGWGTEDAGRALSYLKRFGSVTVLNGHIHQIIQKVEGNVTFHPAASTAYPQPAPGTAPAPGPMTVPAADLHKYLGVRTVDYVASKGAPVLIDTTLVA